MPKSSALPSPIAEPANAKSGKQQGESIAVRKSPLVPNLSMLLVSLILNCAVPSGIEPLRFFMNKKFVTWRNERVKLIKNTEAPIP